MSEPFLAEIVMFAGNFAPRGWAFCQGQILSIAQNTALFSLLGTTFGGNGQTTFAGLPSIDLGEVAGEPTHTLIITEMPAHNHQAQAAGNSNAGNSTSPSGNTWASSTNRDNIYVNAAPNGPMAANTVTVGIAGGSQPHNNMQPFLGINFIIAVEGIYPSRN
jgi:microcystin-dependent protein